VCLQVTLFIGYQWDILTEFDLSRAFYKDGKLVGEKEGDPAEAKPSPGVRGTTITVRLYRSKGSKVLYGHLYSRWKIYSISCRRERRQLRM